MQPCPRCQLLFFCGADTDAKAVCWCRQLPALMIIPTTEQQANNPVGCYCPDCLSQMLAEQVK